MATGWIQTIQIVPPRDPRIAEVEVVAPYARKVLFSGTIAACITFLSTTYGFTEKAAADLIRKGRELRGILKGVGYIQPYDTVVI